MIGHYFKVVWNRKRANALILVEILVSFFVLCIVFSVVAYYASNWRRPLGFDYRNTWTIEVGIPEMEFNNREVNLRSLETSRRILAAMKSHPEVLTAAPLHNTPYSGSMSRSGINLEDGKLVQFLASPTTAEAKDVLKLEVTAGRWLEPGDEAIDYTPMVINEKLARRLFGRENPLNRTIDAYTETGEPDPPKKSWQLRRVVGVIRDYRKTGELSESPYASFQPKSMTDPDRGYAPWSYMIRLNTGTPAVFEETLLKSLRAEAPEWTFEVKSVEKERERYLKGRFMPLVIGGTLAGFLILMVGMGLLGVLWQNVTRRTQELGLRRALGATAGEVRNQIIGEIVMLATLALVLGSVLFLQVPLIGVFSFVSVNVFLSAIALSILVIYPFVILCGLYPGWLATRVDPSQALQYE